MSWTQTGRLLLAAILVIAASGCSMAPKSFRKINDPAAITRARSVSLGRNVSPMHKVPALIDKLEDSDPVVRLAAYEELKKDTGRSFGYRPWANPTDRTSAVSRWRTWWNQRQGGLARSGQNP